MKDLKHFMNEIKESVMFSDSSTSQDTDRIAAYNDLTPEQRKDLDEYCNTNFDKQFMDCTFDEQSTARSTVWATKNDPDDIKKQNDKDKTF